MAQVTPVGAVASSKSGVRKPQPWYLFLPALGGTRPDARAILHALAVGTAFLLAFFHSWLLWLRLSSGRPPAPGVALRWTAALGLLAGLIWLRRRGGSLLRGRRAAVFWLLVLLLHASAFASPDSRGTRDLLDSGLVLALPVAATLLGVVRLAFEALAARALGGLRVSLSLAGPPDIRLTSVFLSASFPRPPPAS